MKRQIWGFISLVVGLLFVLVSAIILQNEPAYIVSAWVIILSIIWPMVSAICKINMVVGYKHTIMNWIATVLFFLTIIGYLLSFGIALVALIQAHAANILIPPASDQLMFVFFLQIFVGIGWGLIDIFDIGWQKESEQENHTH